MPWYRLFWSRIGSHYLLKATGTTVFMYVFFVGYLYLLRNPLFPVTVMPLTELDRLISFRPEALFLYLSLWFYVSLPAALLATRDELYAFGWQVGSLCLAGMACFFFWPTQVPPSGVEWNGFIGSGLLKGLDAAGNACPSLHVATAVFSCFWLARLFREIGCPRSMRFLNYAWCFGIVYSTLAIKQHVAIDMFAGTLLGAGAAIWSLAMREKRNGAILGTVVDNGNKSACR